MKCHNSILRIDLCETHKSKITKKESFFSKIQNWNYENIQCEKQKPGELKIPIEVLADLLEDGGADLRESDLTVLRFGEASCRRKENQIEIIRTAKP